MAIKAIQRSRNPFADQERQRHRAVSIGADLSKIKIQADGRSHSARLQKLARYICGELINAQLAYLARGVDTLMYERKQLNAIMRAGKPPSLAFIAGASGLNVQQTGDHLQIVLDPMMHLPQQRALFGKRLDQAKLAPS